MPLCFAPTTAPASGLKIETRFSSTASSSTLRRRAAFAVLNPHDNSMLRGSREATAEPTSTAPSPPRERAFPAWSRMAAADRGRLLLKLADAIEADADDLATLEALDTGHPMRDAQRASTCRAPRRASATSAAWPTSSKATVVPVEAGFLNYVLREPVGVVGQIVPWNFPLMFTSWKMAPGAGRRQHGRDEAGRADAAVDAAHRRADGRRSAFPTASSTSCRATATPRASDSPSIRDVDKIAFTGSTAIGPAHRPGVGGQPEEGAARARRQGREHRVRRRSISPRRSTARPARSSTTRGRPASPARG